MKKLLLFLRLNPPIVLFCLWALATLININKAFHIDDAFHLEAAQWIEQKPLKPMSGSINWYNTSEPTHHFNQPPLYFYLIAAIGSIFGFSEIPLHLFQSCFVFICILYFYKLVSLFNVSFSLVATSLLILSPAFLVNQNLMADIPILAVSIIFIYLLLTANGKTQSKRLYLAAIILGFGLLIKYSLLPLLPVLAYRIWQTKKIKLFPVILIPISFIACWTLFNYIEFGSSHIAGRPRNVLTLSMVLHSLVAFVLTLGCIVPFTLLLIQPLLRQAKRSIRHITVLLITVTTASAFISIYGLLNSTFLHSLFWIIFFVNGLILCTLSFITLIRLVSNPMYQIIILWGFGVGSFIVLFAPFMATRHVLLLMPPLLLVCCSLYNYVSARVVSLAVCLTVSLGIILSVSDWHYANFYRETASKALKYVPAKSRVWTVGHWGWQWYSKQAGMHFYDYCSSNLKEGDYFIIPTDISKQKLKTNLQLQKTGTLVYENHVWNKVTTAQFARFYNSFSTKLPWYITFAPTDSVIIYKVIGKSKNNPAYVLSN